MTPGTTGESMSVTPAAYPGDVRSISRRALLARLGRRTAGQSERVLNANPSREPGVATDVTLTEVLGDLARAGYEGSFRVDDDGHLCCPTCGACASAAEADLQGLRRLEGASDPADMSAVLALRCRSCGCQGAVVVRYGPEADGGEAELLRGLAGRPVDHLSIEELPRGSALGDDDDDEGEGEGEQSDAGGDSDVTPDPARSPS